MASKITSLRSTNHAIDIEFNLDKTAAKITLKDCEKRGMTKDFVLTVKDEKINDPSCIVAKNEYGEQAILINALPDLRPPHQRYLPLKDISDESDEEEDVEYEPKLYEYVFLIDRSGSMSGSPIKLAVEAVKLFLHSIPLGAKFNVVSYGSNYTKLFPTSVEYNDDTF